MRILVTGGAGFIGSHLVDAYLAAGHEVGVVDDLSTGVRAQVSRDAQFWKADIRTPALSDIIQDFRPAIISHHAAQMSVSFSAREPRTDAEVNILGTLNLLEAAVRYGVQRVVFSSTGGAMYGDHGVLPTGEKTMPAPVSPYGVAKLAVEKYLHAFHVMHGLQAVALRYANVYGPRQNPHGEAGVVAIFCKAVLDGRELTVNGDGKQTRDYVYVHDIVTANLRATDIVPDQGVPVLNIGTGEEASVNDLVRLLGETIGRPLRARYGPPRPGEQRRSALDAGLARATLAWEPATDLRSGLGATFEWFRNEMRNAR